MTSRKIDNSRNGNPKRNDEVVFGYKPGASRSTGALISSDEPEPDDELMIDDDDSLREYIREAVNEIVKKCGSSYCLYTKHKKNGKRRKLGKHSSKAGAERQEKAIHAHGG